MSHFIPFFKEEELIGQASLEMKFQDKHLVRCLTFAKHCLRKAINICQQDIAAGIYCILTESDTHFAIWREQPSESQKGGVEATPKLQPQLNNPQMSRSKEEEISSQIEAFELVYAASPPVTDVNYSTPRSAFLALFNQELAQHIGPRADYLINKLLAERPNLQPQQMVEAIVAEISDPKESQNIQKSLEHLTRRVI
ncbi:MAG: hypothetical protein MJA27_21225 [Pseudanabaenales cyanobacterium]|nr:hypothetical protein [Pseudanabaenales cyanobacterium]